MKKFFNQFLSVGALCLWPSVVWASEADLKIPDLHEGTFSLFGGLTGYQILLYGAMIILGTVGISLYQFVKIKALPAHKSMLDIAETIFQTCKTYLAQQVKFLAILFAIIAVAMSYYFIGLQHESFKTLGLVLLFSVVGMAGSTLVAFYGIRVNTYANARTAFASLRGIPWEVVNIPLRAGMSVGLFLISVELVMMVIILLFVPRDIVGYCFLGFAIGESLGASALRIAGGIFTKIADIGSDLKKMILGIRASLPTARAIMRATQSGRRPTASRLTVSPVLRLFRLSRWP
jgi:K(+)-stimulated pyrophosphate-energized sodium pump